MSISLIRSSYPIPVKVLPDLLGTIGRKADMENMAGPSEIDWHVVFEQARHHRVLPQFHHVLAANWPADMDIHLRAQIDRHAKVLSLNARFLTSELLRALDAFKEEGIPVIAFKGPVLSDMAYGACTMREFGDLDLFVKPNDYLYAKNMLEKRGFVCPHTVNKEHQIGQVHLFNTGDRVSIDLHYRLIPKHFPRLFDPNILWRSTFAYTLYGKHVTTFTPPVMLIISCIQALKDRWERLYNLIDIGMLIESYGAECAVIALEKASSWKVRRILLLGLSVTRDLLDVVLPDEINRKIAADCVIQNFRREIYGAMIDAHITSGLIQKKHRMRLLLQDRARDRASYALRIFPVYLRLVLDSNKAVQDRRHLPRPFGFLYPVVQIFHIIFSTAPRRILQMIRSTYDALKIS